MRKIAGQLSKEETIELAQIFNDNSDAPIGQAWTKLIKGKIESYYLQLASTPDNAVRLLCLQILQDFDSIQEKFIKAGENIKVEDKRQEEKDIEKGGE